MGRGWKIGENEIGMIVTTLGDGNLIDKDPSDVETAGKAKPVDHQALSDIEQLKADVAALKAKVK